MENDVDGLVLETENGFYNDVFGASVATGINPAFIATFPTIAADSWITIGLESQNVGDQVAISTVEDTEQPLRCSVRFRVSHRWTKHCGQHEHGRRLVCPERHPPTDYPMRTVAY